MFWLVPLLVAISSLPHPFHVSVAEAQWNERMDRLQVALRLTPRDLDDSLSQFHGRPVRLEGMDEGAARRLVEPYLSSRIFLADSPEASSMAPVGNKNQEVAELIKARASRFHWVGWEQEVRYTWIYFELARPAEREARVWLHNRVMFEVDATQINTLQLMRTQPPIAIRTTWREPAKEIPLIAAGSVKEPLATERD